MGVNRDVKFRLTQARGLEREPFYKTSNENLRKCQKAKACKAMSDDSIIFHAVTACVAPKTLAANIASDAVLALITYLPRLIHRRNEKVSLWLANNDRDTLL